MGLAFLQSLQNLSPIYRNNPSFPPEESLQARNPNPEPPPCVHLASDSGPTFCPPNHSLSNLVFLILNKPTFMNKPLVGESGCGGHGMGRDGN